MGIIVIGSVLLGVILGAIFKSYALLPVGLLAIALVLAYPAPGMESLLNRFFETVIVITSIQAGYFCFGLFAPPVLRKRMPAWTAAISRVEHD